MSANPQGVSGMSVRYRFGTFELDTRSAELRRNGVKLRLQEQPFLVLRKLLETAGVLVTREELQGALWPADTFVDFDTSLNTAIKRLREALGDSADIPVFIETIPRRGYRFLAPVQVLPNGSEHRVESLAATIPTPTPPTVARSEVVVPTKGKRLLRFGPMFAGLALAAVLGGGAVALRSPQPMPRITDSTQLTFDGLSKGNLHTHGGYIYFNEQLPDRVTLVQVPIAGGIPKVLDASDDGLYLADISHDGGKLLVLTPDHKKQSARLRVMELASGSIHDVANTFRGDASWTPDGSIVYTGDQDVYEMDADGSHPRKLFSAPGPVDGIRFSPNGSKIRFTVGSKVNSDHTMWEARADGSNAHQILTELSGTQEVCCGRWTPDGNYFLFQIMRDGGSKIWVLPEHAPLWNLHPRPLQLTTGPPNFYMGAPTADGKKLVVTSAEPRAELVRYDADSGHYVPFLGGISAGDVEPSRDAQSVVYVRYPEGTLWRAKEDGSNAAQLTGPSLRVSLPHWSPDGTRIAFSGARPGKPWNVFLIPSAGGPAEQITNGPISDLDPTWSPDGTKIAFGERRSVAGKFTDSIQILDLATRKVEQLAGSDGICCPRWSPDGKFMLATHGTYDDLVLYDFARQKWTTLLKDKGLLGFMEWMPDGKTVLFDTFDTPQAAFYRLRLSDLKLETVASTLEVRRYYGDFGPWTGMAADGSPLLVRDISNEEAYALDLQLP
jgi:Tol biopolymer transport system component/DNA-binding winged helix-turn-helix (wHTH) protein